MTINFTGLPTDEVRALQTGGLDAYGQTAERSISDGEGNPCRHCLGYIAKGKPMLILAHRPFPAPQPYAETGPIFLCAEPCERHEGVGVPEVIAGSGEFLIKGYSADDRIVYGTGKITPVPEIGATAQAIFGDARVAYIHARSARNNCYQCRIDRG